jgi:hypothetical protein
MSAPGASDSAMTDRDVIFISHATPDDNEFVRWLGTRLTGHGFHVWADIFDLNGGTPFWGSIEECIRNRAIKVIAVVSRASCDPGRSGVRNEIALADTVRKSLKDDEYIIPVRIDDVPFGDLPIQIHQLNALDFSAGWGGKLGDLVECLDKAAVPRAATDLTAEFERWRAASVRSEVALEKGAEPLLTNILPILRLPEAISFFEYEGENKKFEAAVAGVPLPTAHHNRFLLSFAGRDELQSHLPAEFKLSLRSQAPIADFLDGSFSDPTGPKRRDARSAVTRMLRESFEHYLGQRGLLPYDCSSGMVMFFPKGLLKDDRVVYVNASGRTTYKQVSGESKRLRAFWHLGMRAVVKLEDPHAVRLRPYVVFTRDGKTPLSDAEEMTKLRRKFCVMWFNNVWRPLFQGFYQFLGEGADVVDIPIGASATWGVAGSGLRLVSEMSMPGDLAVADAEEEPEEPDDSDDDDFPNDDDSED